MGNIFSAWTILCDHKCFKLSEEKKCVYLGEENNFYIAFVCRYYYVIMNIVGIDYCVSLNSQKKNAYNWAPSCIVFLLF